MNKHILIALILAMMLIPSASALTLDDIDSAIKAGVIKLIDSAKPLSIASITPADIKFSDKLGDVGKYYVLTAYIGARTDGFEIILPKDKEIDLGNNQIVKNSNEVKVLINPLSPTQTIGVQQGTQIQYMNYRGAFGIGDSYTTPEYYQISGNWLTTTKYRISTYSNGAQMYTQDVSVNYQNAQEVKVGSIAIENIGQLGNGYNTPTQNFVVVKDPNGVYHLFTEAGFQNFVDRVNRWIADYGWTGSYDWRRVWNKGSELGVLPRDENPSDATVSYNYLNGKVNQIVLTLPVSISSSTIIVYVPQSVANGIIILKQASIVRIVDISGCPTLDEGKSGSVMVKVRNDGSADYIGVNIRSDNHDINGNTRAYFNAGETKTFTFTLTARGTASDATVYPTVFADGTALTGGDDSRTISCAIRNVIGFTPTPVKGTPLPTPTPANPQGEGEDLTWIFWGAVVGIGLLGFWYTKNPWFLALIIMIAGIYFIGIIFDKINTLADKLNPFNWF